MQIEPNMLQLLMEIGMAAGGYGYMKEAEVIFAGLKAVRPEHESPLIGLAFAKMNSNEPEEAVKILEEALKVNPGSDLARSFLGLAHRMAGRNEQCASILREVVDRNQDQAAVRMASGILAEFQLG